MTPIQRVPSDLIRAQWRYIAAARGPWSALWRRVVAAWRMARVARRHLARQRAWVELRARHRELLREISHHRREA